METNLYALGKKESIYFSTCIITPPQVPKIAKEKKIFLKGKKKLLRAHLKHARKGKWLIFAVAVYKSNLNLL